MSAWENLRVGARLGLAFAMALALTLAVAAFGQYAQHAVADLTERVTQTDFAKTILIYEVMLSNQEAVADTSRMLNMTDVEEVKRIAKVREASASRANDRYKRLEQLAHTDDDKRLLAEMERTRKVYSPLRSKTMGLILDGKNKEANQLWDNEVIPALSVYRQHLRKMIDYQNAQIDQHTRQIASTNRSNTVLVLTATALAMLLGIALAVFITRSLLNQLGGEPQYATSIAHRIAAGDLTVDVKTRGGERASLLAAMKGMREQLADMTRQIKQSAQSITSASQEIARGNADLSQRTEEQASSLEETASSIEQLTAGVKHNADNARQANQFAAGASSIALKGGDVVGQVVDTMMAINDSSKKVVDIISVIDGIAFQTNILALNAAVEAARAGEQGRGFAVVASEVRTLAQRSAAAAKDIKALITDSVTKVENGTRLVEEAGKTMDEIVTSVKRVTDIMAEISAASQEQSAGIEQVNQAVTQMDEATQQNAALVEQAAASAESLQEQAHQLSEAVAVFAVDGNGPGAERIAVNAAPLAQPERKNVRAKEFSAPLPTAAKRAA